jgi:hypothetical protein
VVYALLDANFTKHAQVVNPEPLLNGYDVMQALQLTPGPEIGRILHLIEEAQASGEIDSREEALAFAHAAASARIP